MKLFSLSACCLMLLSGCQLVSPIITDYNGVRRDVATYINTSWQFSLKERDILVAYAKEQQKLLAWEKLDSTEQKTLLQQRSLGRYCAEQKIKPRKLDLVDAQIFTAADFTAPLQAIHTAQKQLMPNLKHIDCTGKI